MKDNCAACGNKTPYDEFDEVEVRFFYVEGAGQLCAKCYGEIYGNKTGLFKKGDPRSITHPLAGRRDIDEM